MMKTLAQRSLFMNRIHRSAAGLLAIQLLQAACATQPIDLRAGLPADDHYLGYVRVVRHASTAGEVSSSDVRVLGLRLRDGLGIGYMRDRRLHVPLDCRLIFIVESQEQLESALRASTHLPASGRCVVATHSTH